MTILTRQRRKGANAVWLLAAAAALQRMAHAASSIFDIPELCPEDGSCPDHACMVTDADCFFMERCQQPTGCACRPAEGAHPPHYEALSAEAKVNFLWDQILATENQNSPEWTQVVPDMLFKAFSRPFLLQGDFWPPGNRKPLHSAFGSTAKVSLDVSHADDHPFTGILKRGAEHGLLRFGSSSEFPGPFGTFGPAFAIKFLQDAVPSANTFGIHFLHGVPFGDFDVQSENYSNHGLVARQDKLGPLLPFVKPMISKFGQSSLCPMFLALDELTREYLPDNKTISNHQVTPFELILEPTLFEGLEFPRGGFTPDIFVDFKSIIPTGTVLFHVYARESPETEANIFIGDIVTESPFVPSSFGDEQLAFRHVPFEVDLNKNPEWIGKFDFEQGCYSGYLPKPDLSETPLLSPLMDPDLDPFDIDSELLCPFSRTAAPTTTPLPTNHPTIPPTSPPTDPPTQRKTPILKKKKKKNKKGKKMGKKRRKRIDDKSRVRIDKNDDYQQRRHHLRLADFIF